MINSVVTKIRCVQLCNNVTLSKVSMILRCGLANHYEKEHSVGASYERKFTQEQQKLVLQTLNEASPEQLSRYNLSKSGIKKIDAWRFKHGQFTTIDDVLDIDGVGIKMLDRLCKNIINAENCTEEEINKKPFKTRGQILSPMLNPAKICKLQSALGIHLYATGISWARINREQNSLTHWDLFEYNLNSKKMSPTDALQLVINISKEIPPSEVYVFEAPVTATPTVQQSPISVVAYMQRVQLLSMLLTLLSTSSRHNPCYKFDEESFNSSQEPNVFFLRYRLPARLFRTLVGTERISAATTVASILTKTDSDKTLNYTPLVVKEELSSAYSAEPPVNKEVLGQALLLTMSFMDVCIYQNSKSLKIVSSKKS